jgi:hypothetical protein
LRRSSAGCERVQALAGVLAGEKRAKMLGESDRERERKLRNTSSTALAGM